MEEKLRRKVLVMRALISMLRDGEAEMTEVVVPLNTGGVMKKVIVKIKT